MKILVFVKATLDSDCRIQLTEDSKNIEKGPQKHIINAIILGQPT